MSWQLTPHRRRLVTMVAAGASDKEIAAALGRSETTVKHLLATMYRQLDVPNRTALAVKCLRLQLINWEDV